MKNNLPRAALILASIFNQNKPIVVQVDNLFNRSVACATYHGPYGVQSFQVFRTLQEWHQDGNSIHVDRLGRPIALGIHVSSPFETALADITYMGCLWVPEKNVTSTSDVKISNILGGLQARSEYVGESISNTWTQVYAMEHQLARLPGGFVKGTTGWWEHYSPEDWNSLISGRVRAAWVGFPVASIGNPGVYKLGPRDGFGEVVVNYGI